LGVIVATPIRKGQRFASPRPRLRRGWLASSAHPRGSGHPSPGRPVAATSRARPLGRPRSSRNPPQEIARSPHQRTRSTSEHWHRLSDAHLTPTCPRSVLIAHPRFYGMDAPQKRLFAGD
jgi:hypothetical protein